MQTHFLNKKWSGNKYRGETTDTGDADGRGFKIFATGGIYEGFFQDNNFNGYGRGVSSNGNCYEGQFDNNDMHGYGIYLDMEN